jgi:hypothetical protein
MHNAIFPVRIDEIAHPRAANESFLKIYTQPRRQSTSSPSSSTTGIGNQSDISVLLRNIGDADVSFKVMAALRSHASETQVGDTAYAEEAAAQTLKAGGFIQLLIQKTNKNLFSFVMTSATNSVIKVAASSAADLVVWKTLEREGEKGTDLDEFLQDELPKEFYSNNISGAVVQNITYHGSTNNIDTITYSVDGVSMATITMTYVGGVPVSDNALISSVTTS